MAGDAKGFGKLKPLHQVLIVAGLCGGVLGAFWYWFLAPMQQDIAARGTQLADLQVRIDKGLMRKAVLEQFKKEAKALEVQLEELKRVLPRDKETDEVLRAVESSARSSGLRIQSILPRSIVDHEVYTEWPIQMQVLGTYHDIGGFLDRIRKLPRIVNIGGLKIAARGSEGDFLANVGATYTATTFVYREEAANEAAAAAAERARKK
jgi:type IV pilus assembly protein PilO